MRIQNNIMAMNTHRQYSVNNSAVAKSAEKLSSGYRINRAGDDAAGLAISEKMRSQIRGLGMASKNSQDAISLVQTAEGALQEVHSMLQRMNELAVQAATGTNQQFDRGQINKEFNQLKREINDISEQTTFNNMKILDGSMSNEGPKRSAETAGMYVTNNLADATGATVVTGDSATVEFDINKMRAGDTLTIGVTTAGGTTVSLSHTWAEGDTIDSIVASFGSSVSMTSAGNSITFQDAKITFDPRTNFTPATITEGFSSMRIQVGALENEQLNIEVKSMNTAGLKLDGVECSDQDLAGKAITATRAAIDMVSDQRSLLGAMQNRLEHKISNLDNTAENLQAAESRIRDVDIAKEMTTYTKNNILSQASTAMLAQANAAPQSVLSLLQ